MAPDMLEDMSDDACHQTMSGLPDDDDDDGGGSGMH
jgi:hypothetical protein